MNLFNKLFSYVPEKKIFGIFSIILSLISSVVLMLPFWYLWQFLLSVMVAHDFSKAKFYAIIMVALLISYLLIYILAVMCSHLVAFRLESNMRKKEELDIF